METIIHVEAERDYGGNLRDQPNDETDEFKHFYVSSLPSSQYSVVERGGLHPSLLYSEQE